MHFGTLANLMVFASFSIKVNEIGSTANAAVLWSVAQIVRFSEWAPNDISTLKGKKGILSYLSNGLAMDFLGKIFEFFP